MPAASRPRRPRLLRALTFVAGVPIALAVAMLFTLAVMGALYSPNTTIPPGFRGTRLMVGDLPLRVLQEGRGPDVILIHGTPGSLEDWEPVATALASSFRVTRFDRPGSGFSGDDGEYSFEHNADVVLRLMDKLGIAHAIVVGHSYGGPIALALASRAGARVDACVVVDTLGYRARGEPEPFLRVLALPVLGRGVAAAIVPWWAPPRIRELLPGSFRRRPPDAAYIEQRVTLWSTAKVGHAFAHEMLGISSGLAALSPRYPYITRPVGILVEAGDPFWNQTAERLHDEIPGSTIRTVSGTGHMMQFDRTDAIVLAVRQAAGKAGLGPPVDPAARADDEDGEENPKR